VTGAAAGGDLPPVATAGEGVTAVAVPMPDASLRYAFVYAVECGTALVLVDAGWHDDAALAALEAGLATIGASTADVAGMLVTHVHADHYGLVDAVRRASGAWVAVHPGELALIDYRYRRLADLRAELGRWLARHGAPGPVARELRDAVMAGADTVPAVDPDVLLEDGDRAPVPGRAVHAVHTPGHTPGHLSFHVPGSALLFTGDHVLPRITPNVASTPLSTADPLADFLGSLDRVAALGDVTVLPAHEWAFGDLPARAAEIRAHHDRRLDEVLAVLAGGATTAWEVAGLLTWSRPLDGFPAFLQRAALGETLAHLVHLANQGRVDRRTDGAVERWAPRPAAGGAPGHPVPPGAEWEEAG
jgi:glyoxylase-like metal-dependent hydrolase (beta-lactamase superfamily II)